MKTTKVLLALATITLLHTSFIPITEAATTGNIKSNQTVIQKDQLTDKLAVDLAAKYQEAYLFVSSGGGYKDREYDTFLYNDLAYRYLSININTKAKLMKYLTEVMTSQAAEHFINDLEILEHKGKLAQKEADIGSLEEWKKATAEVIKKDKDKVQYRLTVPIGEPSEKIMYSVEYQLVENIGWRVSKRPVVDLDIPDKINPVHILFTNLLSSPQVAQKQLLPTSYFEVNEFKKGLKKVDLSKIKEIDRGSHHVEYIATIFVELEKDYKGPLVSGENKMYFIVQPNGYMDFKIHQVGQIEMY